MRKSLLTILQILFTVSLGFAQEKQGEFMRLHSERIKVNDSLCYQVRKEYSGIDTTAWEPFCGVLDNFYFRSWYEYTLQVEEYNPHADTICVIKTIAQYPKGQFMKIHSERITVNDSLCYQVRKGFSRRDKTPWEPFCGKFSNLWYEEGYGYTLYVKEYNPHADTIHVIKTIARYDVPKNYQYKKSQYMLVNAEKIMVNDSLCYQVKPRFGRSKDWKPFCGVLDNFYFIWGYEREVIVKKYDLHADTMSVIKECSRNTSFEDKKRNLQARKRMGMQTNNNDSVQTTPTSNGE